MRIRALLEGFGAARARSDVNLKAQASSDRESFSCILNGFHNAADKDRHQQEQRADDFNLLAVMGLIGNEVRHSMVLAWLLDHDMRKFGTHAQGNLGFRFFLQQFELPPHYAECKYWVKREFEGDDSIIDVEIACRGEFLIHPPDPPSAQSAGSTYALNSGVWGGAPTCLQLFQRNEYGEGFDE